MPFVPKSTISERIGFYYTGYLFSLAGVVFRESSNTDVGIDAQIELVDLDGNATGKLAGVQIKSGDSFVETEQEIFTFRAKQKHFEYWIRYRLPVIGIVFSPSLNKAVWFDLTKDSRRIVEEDGPYHISTVLNKNNELNQQNILNDVCRLIHQFYDMPVSTDYVERVANLQAKAPEKQDEEVELESREAAWKRLTNILLASKSEPEVLADAGYKLSWYFPIVPQSHKDFFIERISHIKDKELINVIRAISYYLLIGEDKGAELICDLLTYLPNQVDKLKHIARQHIITVQELETLFQLIEYFTEEFEEEFREEILNSYKVTENDIFKE